MITSSSLSPIDRETLRQVFNEAFSDYDLPLNMSPEVFEQHLTSNAYSGEDSVGLFDDDKLIGFLLIGRRQNVGYDAGTGILKAYRGQGLAHTLIDKAVEHLASRGCTQFVLEVLDTNTRAKNLYIKHGFTLTRSLYCYAAKKADLPTASLLTLEAGSADYDVQPLFEPSYQNSKASVIEGGYTKVNLIHQGKQVGVVWYRSQYGSIAQINIEPAVRTQKLLEEALVAIANSVTDEKLRLINVDENDSDLNAALKTLGFELFTTQSEMVCPLDQEK